MIGNALDSSTVAHYAPLEVIGDDILKELSELSPKPQPGELLIFVAEILVNNWNESKYLQHLTHC